MSTQNENTPADLSKILCDCGNGHASNESVDGGLYTGEDGVLRRICGPCWLRETCTPPVVADPSRSSRT